MTETEFSWDVPAQFNFCRHVMDLHDQDQEAMLWVDDEGHEQRLTFGDFNQRSRRLAAGLRERGVERGDSVIVVLPRLVEWWDVMLACLRAGFVVSPGTTQLQVKDFAYRMKAAQAAVVVTDAENADKVDAAMAEAEHPLKLRVVVGGEDRRGWARIEDIGVDPGDWAAEPTSSDDRAMLYFTSGTTGHPKMTVHTQASYGIGHRTTALWLGVTKDDLHWNLSDTGWAKAAYSSLFGPWIAGARLFVHHTPRFDGKATLDVLARYPITTLCGAPTIFRVLVQQDLSAWSFPSLRDCVAAGEPLNPEVMEVWKDVTGLTIRDGYGQTETSLMIGNSPGAEVRPGSMGLALPGFEVAVVGPGGERMPAGEEGELAVRVVPESPVGLFTEYWKDTERTEAVFHDGWYWTGDRATRDEDGFFWFVGRADDVIITAGYRIGPFEVESALLEHDAVAESAVVAKPDETRGEIVKAFVVLAAGYEPGDALVEELQAFARDRTAPYKYPREIEFVDTLPKTISGKIRRIELRARG